MDYAQRRQQQSRQTEQDILQAALELMRERGFDGVSVRDVCTAAGITTGAFYHHFLSKEDLLSKGFTPMDAYVKQALDAAKTADPLQRLQLILAAYASFIQEESGELTGRYYERRLGNPQSHSIDNNRFIRSSMLDCFQQAKNEGLLTIEQTPGWLADFCYRHFRGVVIDWVLSGYGYPLLERMQEDYGLFERVFRT
ncbi:MAG: TetR/AcrR family transcriptional regulator [Oscillospiraceae bacterium]